jgi:hypothetical protein
LRAQARRDERAGIAGDRLARLARGKARRLRDEALGRRIHLTGTGLASCERGANRQ